LISRYIAPHKAPQDEPRRDSVVSRYDIDRIIKYAPAELIGRESELKVLVAAWQQAANGEKRRPHILTFVALGGEGKTSLVAKWAAELAHNDWPGCDAAFAWSFYSQGTREDTQASSDTFLAEALRFFGDDETAGSAKSGFEKGKRLAHIVAEKHALLILDGTEPLQYAPGPPMDGKLKDDGVSAMLKALAATNRGLCVVTTRYSIPDLRAFWQTTAPEIRLASLSREAGVHFLKTLGVKGTQQEFQTLVKDVKGHALTVNLLGTYLRDAHNGDIRKRDLVRLEEADAEEQSEHAFHVMDAYVTSFKAEGENGRRALSILRLLGLFDRPASADCLNALWTSDEIGGLTGPLIGLTEAQRNITLARLQDANLLTVNRETGSGRLLSLDAHPLIREYFANRLRKQFPGAWRAAHRRLYEYLCATTPAQPHPSLEDLQPLFQAVAHGCQAGLQQDACERVYHRLITRGSADYVVKILGAIGSDLGAIASFFEPPWSRISPAMTEPAKAWLVSLAAFNLRALGRLTEALEPMRVSLEMAIKQKNWVGAAARGSNLSELELTLGEVAEAVRDAEQSATYADRSGNAFERIIIRTTHADALHQAGRGAEAKTLFREAEQMQKESWPEHPLLYSLRGFQYCELLLASSERAAHQMILQLGSQHSGLGTLAASCRAVSQRAAQTLTLTEQAGQDILSPSLDHLTLGRAALYEAILERSAALSERPAATASTSQGAFNSSNAFSPVERAAGGAAPTAILQIARHELDAAVDGLRRSNSQDHIVRGLLIRAWLRFFTGAHVGPESAQEDFDEAWEIADRGPMRLFMADIHLYRARLFHAVKPYPWNKFEDGSEGRGPKDELADARKLIERCGYWRRKEELEDAEEAAKNWD